MSRIQQSPTSHKQQQASILNSHCSTAVAERYDHILTYMLHSFPHTFNTKRGSLISKYQNLINFTSVIIKSYPVSTFR